MSELLVVDEEPDPLSSSNIDCLGVCHDAPQASGTELVARELAEIERQQTLQLCVTADIILRSHPERQGDPMQKSIVLQDATLRRIQSPLHSGTFAYFFNIGEANERSYYTWTTNNNRVRMCTNEYEWQYATTEEVCLAMESAFQLSDEPPTATKDRNFGRGVLAKFIRL